MIITAFLTNFTLLCTFLSHLYTLISINWPHYDASYFMYLQVNTPTVLSQCFLYNCSLLCPVLLRTDTYIHTSHNTTLPIRSYLSTTQLELKRPPETAADILILSKMMKSTLMVIIHGVCPGLCCRNLVLWCVCVCAANTTSQVLSNRGCAQDGALQPLVEEEGEGRKGAWLHRRGKKEKRQKE